MRSLCCSLLVLLLLLLAGLANGFVISRSTQRWENALTLAEECAAQEQWQASCEAMDNLCASWDQYQPYLHITMEHSQIDTANTLIRQCRHFAQSHDGAALSATAVQLRCQLQHLAEMEQLRAENVF